MKIHTVPNPSSPRALRPVKLAVTDRAQRYRAQKNAPAGPKRCVCGSTQNIVVDHIDGRERNGAPENLAYLCKSCNTKKGIVFKRAGIGTRTIQYNGKKRGRRPAVDAKIFGWAWGVLRGAPGYEGDPKEALRIVEGTRPAQRHLFNRELWETRKERGDYAPF